MKKSKSPIIIAAVVFVLLAGCGVAAFGILEKRQEEKADRAAETLITQQAASEEVALITKEEALQTALNAAEAKESDIKHLKIKLDKDDDSFADSKYIYEIDFTFNGMEYEFDIDAVSNIIISSDVESPLD